MKHTANKRTSERVSEQVHGARHTTDGIWIVTVVILLQIMQLNGSFPLYSVRLRCFIAILLRLVSFLTMCNVQQTCKTDFKPNQSKAKRCNVMQGKTVCKHNYYHCEYTEYEIATVTATATVTTSTTRTAIATTVPSTQRELLSLCCLTRKEYTI